MMLLTRAAWVCQGVRDQLCPQHNVLELPHGPLAQAARAPWLRLPAAPVRQLGGYGNSPRSTGLREGTGHLLIRSRDEGISGEPSQLPQALSVRSPNRWGPIGKASWSSPRGPSAHPADTKARKKYAKRGKQAFKKIHAPGLVCCSG